MKLRLVPITIVCFAQTFATVALASASPHFGWFVEVEPFYAKATDTLLTPSIYAVKVADPAILGDHKQEYHLDLENSWGGRIALGYDFPYCSNSNYGLSVAYTFFDNDNSADVTNNNRNSAGLPVLAPAEFIDITDEASARFSIARSKLDQCYTTFDVLAHKNIVLCNGPLIKTFAGVRYFYLREHLHDYYEFRGDITGVRVENIYDVNVKNETRTIGPHIGAEIFYPVLNGFGVTGQLAGSLLYGQSNSEFHNAYHLSAGSALGDPVQLTSSNENDDAAHVVPAMSGKVGVVYQACLHHCSSLSIEVGYRGDKYFNAVNNVAYQQLLAGDDINSNSNYHDFDLSGPYFSVTFHS